jgi:hypothetical protein
VGRSLLASDAEERVARICARSGRALSAAEALSVQRVARQAATLPSVDQGRLRGELAIEVRDVAARQPAPLRPAERDRIAETLAALPGDASLAEVRAVLGAGYGGRLVEPALGNAAQALRRRIEIVRRRHTARINFREMLYGADLPTEGVLADEVRSATLEAMGPVAGIPVPAGSASAFSVDAAPIGGGANERALSEAWGAALRSGGLAAAGALAIVLLLSGGARGITWLPVALAPAAVAVLPAEILREPLGLWSLSFLAGALAAGAVTALALAGRRDRR